MVKLIFKTILGTILIIVLWSVTLEFFNIETTSLQIGSIAKMSARQACVFFGQETYKREDFTDVNMPDIYSADGGLAVSGLFYNGGTASDIYSDLYGAGSDFLSRSGVVMTEFKGNWESLDLLLERNDAWGIGEFYRDAMMTPLNMGIVYLDQDTIERIMRWNLTSILNNGQVDGSGRFLNIHRDDDGYYVLYKGFRVYTPLASITDIEYQILDLSTEAGRARFQEYTNMDASVITEKTEGASDERNKVVVAGISYSIPIKYEGITSIKKAMEYGWNWRVSGTTDRTAGEVGTMSWDATGVANFEQGGFNGSSERGVLPVPGNLIYYIVR